MQFVLKVQLREGSSVGNELKRGKLFRIKLYLVLIAKAKNLNSKKKNCVSCFRESSRGAQATVAVFSENTDSLSPPGERLE